MQRECIKQAMGPSSRTSSFLKTPWRRLAYSPRQNNRNIPLKNRHGLKAADKPLEPPQSFILQGYVNGDCSTTRQQRFGGRAMAALAATGLVCIGMLAPLPGLAEGVRLESAAVLMEQGAEPSAAALLADDAQLLQAAEAPALVSNSSDVLVQAAKDAVVSSFPDLATTSMTAVGGPIIVEPPIISSNNSTTNINSRDTAGTEGQESPTKVIQMQNSRTSANSMPQQQYSAGEHGSLSSPSAAAGMRQGMMYSMWQAYCHALETSPLVTKVYTGIVGTFVGDLAAQLLTYQASKHSNSSVTKQQNPNSTNLRFKFDAMRSSRLCLFSAVIGTPMGHCEYALLEKFVMPETPTAPAAVAAKVCLDQFVQTPFGMALFFAVMKVLEGKPQLVRQELQSKVVPALLANWKLWPAAQLVNFMLIPTEQRILFGNIVGICWTCIISNMQQGSTTATDSSAAGSSRSSVSGESVEVLQATP